MYILGEIKKYKTQYGEEEAICFNTQQSKYWIKRYLNNKRYEVHALIGVGGLGCVFLAYDNWNFRKEVVIKTPYYMGDFCRPYISRSKERFEKQIKALNKIYELEKKHLCGFSNAGFNSIVNLNDYFKDRNLELCVHFRDAAGVTYVIDRELRENAPFIVMKYIKGKVLNKYLEENGPLDEKRTLKIARHILELLKYLHKVRKTKKGRQYYYILCDLKSENIIIYDDQIYLIDFGAIKIYWLDLKEVELPIFVTDGYAAPDVYSGTLEAKDNPKIDNKFDIFTVGALMVECLTGKHPFNFLVNYSPPIHDFDISSYNIKENIIKVINKATNFNKEKRYNNVQEFLNDIYKIIEELE